MSIHLCQPDGRKSCGACCGMYNVSEGSRQRVTHILQDRTAHFRSCCSIDQPETLRAYKAARQDVEARHKLLGLLRNCPFLGILDEDTGRVGCMVHPAVNGGIDQRDCGAYDRQTCEDYLCAAYTALSSAEKRLLIDACADDSYLYGLVLNDVGLLRGLFQAVADAIGMWPRPPRLHHPRVVSAVGRFLALKADWPWRDPETGVIGAWIPDGDENVAHRSIDYRSLACDPSRFDQILCSLGSEFDSAAQLREAEAVVYAAISAVADAYEALLAGSA